MTDADIARRSIWRCRRCLGILTQTGIGKLRRIGLELVHRNERARPGELIRVDVEQDHPTQADGLVRYDSTTPGALVSGMGWLARVGPIDHFARATTPRGSPAGGIDERPTARIRLSLRQIRGTGDHRCS
jgi:hypothetical protein